LGKYASFGQGIGNLQFAADIEQEPSLEMREYFNSIAEKVGLQGTILKNFKSNQFKKVRLYNEGRRIIDSVTSNGYNLAIGLKSLHQPQSPQSAQYEHQAAIGQDDARRQGRYSQRQSPHNQRQYRPLRMGVGSAAEAAH
jgi:hypothetical protein